MPLLRRFLLLLLVLLCAAPARAADHDLITIAYTADSWGEYSPCPT